MACMSEGDLRPEVEWAVRRWRGEGIDAIASSAGVAPSVVRAATGPIGGSSRMSVGEGATR